MKDIIKKILKESDFDWVSDVLSYDEMDIKWEEHVIPYLTGLMPTYDEDGDLLQYEYWGGISKGQQEDLEPLAKHYFNKELNDIDFKDGKFLMTVSGWDEFIDMFKDCDYQGYICKHTAETVLGEDDYWEPYYDVIYDWKEQVWDSVNDKTYEAIVAHIRKWLIGDKIRLDGEEVVLTEELLNSWLGEKYILGEMINEEVGNGFEDIKGTMENSYGSAYNDAARDEYWVSTHEAIKGVVGDGKWETYEAKKQDGTPITGHQLVFDVTDIFMEVIQAYFDDYCELDYDHECELQYSSFLDNLIFVMKEDIYEELLNPSVSEYPDSDKLVEYFNERLGDDL